MHIVFKFTYIHNNGLLNRIFEEISLLSNVAIKHYQDENRFRLEASGNQPELEQLAELVSSMLPQSLFLLTSSVEEIVERSNITSTKDNVVDYQIPYCPSCQNKVIDTLDPFNLCNVCGFTNQKLSFEDISDGVLNENSGNIEEYFLNLADELIEKEEIELLTYNGKRRFSLLTTPEKKNSSILICDPSNISKYFDITQGELNALMLVEKPSIKLKPKRMFYLENELIKPMHKVFFADDKITLALSTALSKKGVISVYCDNPPSLKVSSSLGENFIINSGRDMLPWSYKTTNNKTICCSIDNFRACINKDELMVDVKENIMPTNNIELVPKNIQKKSEGSVQFTLSHGALRSVVLENNLDGKSLCHIYLSKEKSSNICSYSAKIGYLSMVDFLEDSLSTPKNMLESIASMDDEGERLINNFKTSYPEIYNNLLSIEANVKENSSMITVLWAMAAYVIGLTTTSDVDTACEYLEANALEFQGKSGPRIDHKVMKTEEGYKLDPRLVIRSAISFKLAGVDDYLLSFGFVDSLADFIAQQTEFADNNIGIDGVTLSGSLFENHQLLMRTYNAISSNYKIYRNRRLSIDGENIAVGAVTLGSE